MANVRRDDAAKKMGVSTEKERNTLAQDAEKGIRQLEEKRLWREELKSSTLYAFVSKGALVKDVADGVFGLAEWIGDIFSFALGAVNIYFCAVKVKSVALTVFVSFLALVDLVLGLIPLLGDVLDVVFPSNYLSSRLIVKYIDGECKWVDWCSWLMIVALLSLIGFIVYEFVSGTLLARTF